MYRDREDRLFGKPASIISKEKLNPDNFMIRLNQEDLKKNIDEMKSDSVEVKLLQFARSEYAQLLAGENNTDAFIQHCLDNVYHLSMNDIISKTSKVVDGSLKTEFDVLVYAEAVLGAGLVALAEIGVLAVSVIIGDEPGEEPVPANIAGAAAICGGKEFSDKVIQRYCALIQEAESKRWD